MRDFPGFFTSRRKLLESKSTSRASWVAFAVANFFVRDFNAGFDVVNKYIENVSEKGDQYEESELLLFQNTCLVKLNKHAEALEHLEKNKHQIVDKLSWTVKRAELLALSGHFDVAIEEWETLVRQQPENYHFHRGLQASVLHMPSNICEVVFNLHGLSLPCNVFALSREKKQILREWYNQNAIRSRSIEKIMLFLCIGEEQFAGELRKYMLKCLNNGVPSLNHDICSLALIADPSHSDTLVNITDATQFIDHPVITVALNTVDSLIADGRSELSPVGFLWSLYLKAHLMEIIGSYLPALNAIEEAIVHTPTAIDMHAKKARILKKMGRLVDAAITMDDCRALDLQDRYLNNKATKYFLRADQVEVAMNTIAMFTKHEGDPQKTLFDLQCSWYELESAESYARQKKWGLALKKFNAIRTHFIEQYDDLFDFHGYCIRKVCIILMLFYLLTIELNYLLQTTLRAYLNIMDVQDKSFAHKNFQRAIKGALSIYLHLLDYPEDIDGLGHLSPAERKRERAKLKKKRQQKEDHPVEEETKQADHDPDGEQLLQKDFLIESGSWCNYLQNRIQLCDGDTLSLLAEIMVRRGKHIQAFRSLKFALSRYPNSPSVVVCFVKYALKWRNKKFTGVNPIVATVLKSELISILNSESLGAIADYVENFVQFSLHSKCLKTILGGIKCLHYLDRNNHSRMGELLTSIMEEPRCFTCINEIVETIKVRISRISLFRHLSYFS